MLNLFRLGSIEDSNLIQQQLIDEKRIQMALQILGLTHTAQATLQLNKERFNLSDDYSNLSSELLQQLEVMANINRNGQLTLIKERLNALLSEHRKNLAYSDVLSSFSTNVNAIGVDIIPIEWRNLPFSELSQSICQRYEYWFYYSVEESVEFCQSETMTVAAKVPEAIPEPIPEPAPAPAPAVKTITQTIFFGVNQYELDRETKVLLDDIITNADNIKSDRIVLTGYADMSGNVDWNEELAHLRTRSVAKYLTQFLSPSIVIVEQSVGGTDQFNRRDLGQNRRVDIAIYGTEKRNSL